jgi:hypothetical protein
MRLYQSLALLFSHLCLEQFQAKVWMHLIVRYLSDEIPQFSLVPKSRIQILYILKIFDSSQSPIDQRFTNKYLLNRECFTPLVASS